MKIAIDADIPAKACSALKAVYGSEETEFIHIPSLVPANSQDEFWAQEFRKVGGRVVISADVHIARRPHQILAFQNNELTCFFMQPPWSVQRLNVKVAHLIYWWPTIEAKIDESRVGDVWQVPHTFKISDMKSLRIPDEAVARIERENAERARLLGSA